MDPHVDYVEQARKIPYNDRKKYLLSLPETVIHQELKSLFEKLIDEDLVEITHGRDEFGRDLVIKHTNAWGEKFIGVVVKRGDSSGKLTGKSEGIVDQIVNQTREALSNPCPLREIHGGVVTISEIRVIFVGALTNSAVWRVEHEIKTAYTKTYCLGWLIDSFTDYYPEVFFQGRLAEFIKERISILEKRRESATRATPLSQSFVPPYVSEIEAPGDLTGTVVESLSSRKLPFTDLEDIVKTNKKIIIVGDPGTGKSTVLNKMALDSLEKCIRVITSERATQKLEIPVVLRARDLVCRSIEDFIDGLTPDEPIRKQISTNAILVDGLDEVKAEDRPRIIRDLKGYCDKNQCSLVITTRKVEALREVILPFKQYELLPFDYRQAMDFLRRSVKDTEVLRILDEGLRRDDLRISFTPLALELLIEIASMEREIPASITEIFERYTDNILGRYDIVKGIESVFEYLVKKRFLAELAWQEFFLKDRFVIPHEEFGDFVEAYKGRYKRIGTKLDRFLAEIDRAGILQVGNTVLFRHRSFLEFFAAYRLAQHRGEYERFNEDVVGIYLDLMWTDVAFYYVGILREIPEPIVTMLDRYDETSFEAMMSKALTGRLLQAGWDTPSDVKMKTMSIALRQLEPIREYLDNAIKSRATPVPAIFTDFFIMALAEYSFGSRTFSDEVAMLCTNLLGNCTWSSAMKCLLVLWANRSRLVSHQTKELTSSLMTMLVNLESAGELKVRDKYISLFMLKYIEKEDAQLLRQINRKLANVKRLYPEEVRRLLPAPGIRPGGLKVKVHRKSRTGR